MQSSTDSDSAGTAPQVSAAVAQDRVAASRPEEAVAPLRGRNAVVAALAALAVLLLGAALTTVSLSHTAPLFAGANARAPAPPHAPGVNSPSDATLENAAPLQDAPAEQVDADAPSAEWQRTKAWPRLGRFLGCPATRGRSGADVRGHTHAHTRGGGDGMPGDAQDTPDMEPEVDLEACPGATKDSAFIGALEWTRTRVLAFESRVMTRRATLPQVPGLGGGNVTANLRLSSMFPTHTQLAAYEHDARFQSTAVLAQMGLLLTPFYMFSGSQAVEVPMRPATGLPSANAAWTPGFDASVLGAARHIAEAEALWHDTAHAAPNGHVRAVLSHWCKAATPVPPSQKQEEQGPADERGHEVATVQRDAADDGGPARRESPGGRGGRRLLGLPGMPPVQDAHDAQAAMMQRIMDHMKRPFGVRRASTPADRPDPNKPLRGGARTATLDSEARAPYQSCEHAHVFRYLGAAFKASDRAAWRTWTPIEGVANVMYNASATLQRSVHSTPSACCGTTGCHVPRTEGGACIAESEDALEAVGDDAAVLVQYGESTAAVDAWWRRITACGHASASTPVVHDLRHLTESVSKQRKYPPVILPLRFESGDGLQRGLQWPRATEPIPKVLTAFNVVVDSGGRIVSGLRHTGAYPIVRTAATSTIRHADGSTTTVAAADTFRPLSCLHDAPATAPVFPGQRHRIVDVDEVVVLSQYWGDATFHFWREVLQRLLLMVDYLRAYPHVRIHMVASSRAVYMNPAGEVGPILREAFQLLGLSQSRIVTGFVRGRIVHIPEGTPCGRPYLLSELVSREVWRRLVQLPAILPLWDPRAEPLTVAAADSEDDCATNGARAVQRHAERAWLTSMQQCRAALARDPGNATWSAVPAHALPIGDAVVQALRARPVHMSEDCPLRVLLIRRSMGSRYVENHEALYERLVDIPNVEVTLFDADALPSVEATLKLFAAADVIVAPHGAGLAHMQVASPGSVVVEFLTREYETNLCFMQQAVRLGLVHHAFVPFDSNTDGRIVVDVERVAAVPAALLGMDISRVQIRQNQLAARRYLSDSELAVASSWESTRDVAFGVGITVLAAALGVCAAALAHACRTAERGTPLVQRFSVFWYHAQRAPCVVFTELVRAVLQLPVAALRVLSGAFWKELGAAAAQPSEPGQPAQPIQPKRMTVGAPIMAAEPSPSDDTESWDWGVEPQPPQPPPQPAAASERMTPPAPAAVAGEANMGSVSGVRGGTPRDGRSVQHVTPEQPPPAASARARTPSAAPPQSPVPSAASSDASWQRIGSVITDDWSELDRRSEHGSARGVSSGSSAGSTATVTATTPTMTTTQAATAPFTVADTAAAPAPAAADGGWDWE